MDADHEYPVFGWAATAASLSLYNETLDLFYHRWETGRDREAQESFLEQSTPPYLGTHGGEQVQTVADNNWRRPDAQVAASWSSFWDDENSFLYCPSPDTVCSLETISSAGSVESFFGPPGAEEIGGIAPPGNGLNNEDYSLLGLGSSYTFLRSRSPSSSPPVSTTHSPAMSPSQVTHVSRAIDPEDPEEGEDIDLSESERPGLRPFQFGFSPAREIPSPATRAEPVRVTPEMYEDQVTVSKPNPDYRNVPSPILVPGSPPQHPDKLSLGGFYRIPSQCDNSTVTRVLEGLGIYQDDGSDFPCTTNDEEVMASAPPILKQEINSMDHPNNSDVSVLNIGPPARPLVSTRTASSPRSLFQEQEQQIPIDNSSFQPLSGECATPTPSSSFAPLAHCRSSSSQPFNNTRPSSSLRRRPLRRQGVRPPTILSVEVPQGNNVSWSSPVSPRTSSPDVVFKLDEEVK